MINLPPKTPVAVTNFCLDCGSNEEVLTRLKDNTDLFIQFFKTVFEDSNWMNSNKSLVNKMVSHLYPLSQSCELSLHQSLIVLLTADVAASTLDSETLKECADDLTFTVIGGRKFRFNLNMSPQKKDVDFSEAFQLLDSTIFTLGHLCPKLESVNFSGGKDLTDEAILFLIDRCKDLKKINLDGCLKLTDTSLQAIAKYCGEKLLELNLDGVSLVSDAGIRLIATSCPNLRVLSLGNADLITDKIMEIIAGNLKKIENLKISRCVNVTPLGLSLVIDSLPLKKLVVVEHEDLIFYQKSLITSNVLQHIAKNRKDIEELVFGIATGTKLFSGITLDLYAGFSEISANCTNLTAIEFIGQGFPQYHSIKVSKESILKLIESNPGLTHINLARKIDDDILRQLAKSCPELKAINLTFCSISNNALLELSQSCKKLEAVAFGWNSHINNDTFKKLVDNCPKINSLFISDCDGISWDGLEYAIQKLPLENLFLIAGNCLEYAIRKLPLEKKLRIFFGDGIDRLSADDIGRKLVNNIGRHFYHLLSIDHIGRLKRIGRLKAELVTTPDYPFIRDQTFALIPVHCPNIKKLVINRRFHKVNTNDAMVKIAQGCRNLRLCYIKASGIDAGTISDLKKNNKKCAHFDYKEADQSIPMIHNNIDGTYWSCHRISSGNFL